MPWVVDHRLGLGFSSVVGLVTAIAAILAAAGQQVVHDDTSGASGSETPFAVVVVFLAIGVVSILVALPMNALGLSALGAWFVDWFGP